jgi:hypothetical protein
MGFGRSKLAPQEAEPASTSYRSVMTEGERALEALEADWAALQMHHGRGALFVAAPAIDLHAAARAVANDAVDDVRGHIDAGTLRRPTDDEAARWAASPNEHRFVVYIVQPYVLAQLLTPGDGA